MFGTRETGNNSGQIFHGCIRWTLIVVVFPDFGELFGKKLGSSMDRHFKFQVTRMMTASTFPFERRSTI